MPVLVLCWTGLDGSEFVEVRLQYGWLRGWIDGVGLSRVDLTKRSVEWIDRGIWNAGNGFPTFSSVELALGKYGWCWWWIAFGNSHSVIVDGESNVLNRYRRRPPWPG